MLRLALGFATAVVVGALATSVGLMLVVPAPGGGSAPAPIAAPAAADVTAQSPSGTTFHQLPQWVQTRQIASLWSGPDKQAIQFTRLPAWTFLKVAGAENDRLQVEYAGDGKSRQAGPGWVALGDIQPSDPSGTWLRNHRATQLFAESTGSALISPVPQWSWLVRLDGSANGRLKVRAYSASLSTKIGEGWLATDDIGPTDAPVQSVWTSLPPKLPATAFASHDAFVAAIASAARATSASAPVSVTVAQAILESSWGESQLSRGANNYFGIKANGQIGNDGAVWMRTLEYVRGGSYNVFAAFRAYKSLGDSVADHARLFADVGLYRRALQAANDPDECARRIASAGYSTDPAYAQKLIDLMHRYDLYRFDTPSLPSATTG